MTAFPLGLAPAVVEMRQPAWARPVPIEVGVVVLIAGAFQFSAWKARHLACCREAPACDRHISLHSRRAESDHSPVGEIHVPIARYQITYGSQSERESDLQSGFEAKLRRRATFLDCALTGPHAAFTPLAQALHTLLQASNRSNRAWGVTVVDRGRRCTVRAAGV